MANISTHKPPARDGSDPWLMVHTTNISSLPGILIDRRLRNGVQEPKGCYGFPLGNGKLSTHGKYYDMGVQVFFTMTGATINMNDLSLWGTQCRKIAKVSSGRGKNPQRSINTSVTKMAAKSSLYAWSAIYW